MIALRKLLCLLFVAVTMILMAGCGKKDASSENVPAVNQTETKQDASSFVGTWKSSDHDGENILHYLIFDEEGYWNIRMNREMLERAIRQLPEKYVSFKVMFEGEQPRNNSEHTGCFYEYVAYDADEFSLDQQEKLVMKSLEGVTFSKSSKSHDEVVDEAKNMFLTAQSVVLDELNKNDEE